MINSKTKIIEEEDEQNLKERIQKNLNKLKITRIHASEDERTFEK